jgi:2-polyprenyl-3-methyl-5-hydroxy-6-metoxy-1,4-benzoquinol methylase
MPMQNGDGLIDYKDLLADYNEEEHNQKAEDYFATIADTSYLITKPFYTTVGTPSLLGNFAALIEASDLFMRCEVLDFATGSGWTARLIAQMGCNVTGVDISKSAISIADSATKTFPLVGNAGSLNFAITSALTEGKFENYFDRIIIMDAYHHLPNPQETLKLFFRILKPGGILAMSEPGRFHSKTAPAQAEMRQYGVLERDFIIEEIETDALATGFVNVECGYFSPIPIFVGVKDFPSIFSTHQKDVSKSIENYMTNHNILRMRKPGDEVLDSRRGTSLSYKIDFKQKSTYLEVEIKNTGEAIWLPSGLEVGAVNIGISLVNSDDLISTIGIKFIDLSQDPVKPNQTRKIQIPIVELEALGSKFEIDVVVNGVIWMSNLGSRPLRIEI